MNTHKENETIQIDVEMLEEDGSTYFLATSPQVKGFLVEASTMEEMFDLVPKVLEGFLRTRYERVQKEVEIQTLLHKANMIDYKYRQKQKHDLVFA